MGWWSYEIMGGDTPYDYVSFIKEWIGEKDDPDSGLFDINPKLLENKQDKVMKKLQKEKYDGQIGIQALAYLMMFNGARISPENKVVMIAVLEQDEWAKQTPERKKEIDKILGHLHNYTDTTGKVDLEHVGLFQAIGNHIGTGEDGLVNKNV